MKLKLKDQLKLYLFPKLVLVLHAFGFSWKKLGEITFFNKSILLAQAKNLGKIEIESVKEKQNIFILTMLSFSTFHLVIEALLALGLKSRGHDITFIIDDNALPFFELKNIGKKSKSNNKAINGFVFASKLLDNLNLRYIPISEYIKDGEDFKYLKKYDSILEAGLLKDYKVGVLSDDLPFIREKKEIIKRDIAVTHYIGEKTVKMRPDFVIMSHGIYSTWGPSFRVLDENKIPILTYGRGKKRHTLVFNWNKTADTWDVSREWQKVKDIALTENQLKEINGYLDSRISHKDDVFIYNFGKETSKLETIKNLGLDSKKPIYTLFTNVLWDAASAQREIVFKNPVEWVIETIAWFNNHPEKQLIVKIHPAEVVIGTNMPFYDIILSRIKPNKNIKIIKPNEKVNSWSIYDITNLGIVHTTTVGMEMPLVDKPCMVVSKTHYRDKGFTIDVESKGEYYNLLQNFDTTAIDFKKNKMEALKYAYLLFIRYQIPFNMFYENASTDIRGFRDDKFNEYLKNDTYNRIIENIIVKKDIFN